MCVFRGMKPARVHEIGPEDDPIIAWRIFRVTHYPGRTVTVRSPYRGTIWLKPAMRLRSMAIRGETGFYALKKNSNQTVPYYNEARAKVALRGRVVEYDSTPIRNGGYRAQECEILELHFDRGAFSGANQRLKMMRGDRPSEWLGVPLLLARK